MKAVLLPIQPKWCELIASGKKTIEARKTRPKSQTPFRCYIYCTKNKYQHLYDLRKVSNGDLVLSVVQHNKTSLVPGGYLNGKVIGEFVCDYIIESFLNNNDGCFIESGCLTPEEIDEYQGYKPILYGWHISDLKIYDKPKELREFWRPYPDKSREKILDCVAGIKSCKYKTEELPFQCTAQIIRPPRSWCYVEEN